MNPLCPCCHQRTTKWLHAIRTVDDEGVETTRYACTDCRDANREPTPEPRSLGIPRSDVTVELAYYLQHVQVAPRDDRVPILKDMPRKLRRRNR